MKTIFFVVIIIIIAGCSSSPNKQAFQENKTSGDAFIYPKDSYKFHFNGRHIIVHAIINDSVETSLLFDTGAQSPVFDSTFTSLNKINLVLVLKKPKGEP